MMMIPCLVLNPLTEIILNSNVIFDSFNKSLTQPLLLLLFHSLQVVQKFTLKARI